MRIVKRRFFVWKEVPLHHLLQPRLYPFLRLRDVSSLLGFGDIVVDVPRVLSSPLLFMSTRWIGVGSGVDFVIV